MPHSNRTHPSSIPSPPRDSRSSSNILMSQSRASSPTPSPPERSKPSSIPFPIKPSDTFKSSNAPEPLTPTTPVGQRFSSDKPSQKMAVLPGDAVKVVTQDDMNPSVLGRPSEDEGSEFGGLAYADGDDESDHDELLARGMVSARVQHSPSASSTYSDDHPPTERASTDIGLDKALAALLRSPTSTDSPLSPASSTKHIRASKPPMRSLTSHVQRDPPAQRAAIVRRGVTISGAYSGPSDKSRNDRSSQESTTSGLARHREKTLTCLRCSKDIEDEKWISVENGRGVLCDKCWKNMYLPKV
jgi:PDZ and LIM domain protein 5/6/7